MVMKSKGEREKGVKTRIEKRGEKVQKGGGDRKG